MEKETNKQFTDDIFQSIAAKYTKDFYEFSSKKMDIEQATQMAKKLSKDLFNASLDIAPSNKEGQEGSYNPFFNTISIDKTSFEKMVKSGDLTNFLVILFHEGTHALQQFDKENLITTKNQIFDRDSIKYILETNSPEVYNELKIDPNFNVKIDAAIMLFYLEMDVEKEARKMAYLNTKNLLNFYKNTIDLNWLEKINSIDTMNADEISYYFDAMTNFANQNMNRIEAINSSYEKYDEYLAISGDIYQKIQSIIQNMDIDKFTDDLVKNEIFKNEFPNYDDIKEDNENFDYEKINAFWNKNGIDLKEIQEIVKKADLKSKIFRNILTKLPDTELNKIIDNTKNIPFIFNPTFDVFNAIESTDLRNKIFIDLLKEGKGSLLIMDTKCSTDTKKEAFKIALKTGQYDTALNLYKEFEINMKSFLFVDVNDLSPKQIKEYKKSVLFIEQAKKECLKETKKELTKGFLGKEKIIPDCRETDALFSLLLKTANDTNKRIVNKGEKLIDDYKKFDKSDDISLLDKYYKEKKIGDYSKNMLSDSDIYKKYNFNPSSNVRTFYDFFFLLPKNKNLTDKELTEVYNTAYNFNNGTYENEEKEQPDEFNMNR